MRHKWAFAIGMISVGLANLFTVWGWKRAMKAVDAFAQEDATARLVLFYALITFGVFFIGAIFRFLMRRLVSGVSRHIEFEFRNDLFAHLQKLSPSYYDRNMTGDLMSKATNDIDAIRLVLGPGLMYPVNAFILFPIALYLMIDISPKLTAVAIAPLLLTPLFVRYFGLLIYQRFRAVQDHYSDMSARVQENLAGIRVVKSYAREEEEISIFRGINEKFRTLNMSLMVVQAFFFPVMQKIVAVGFLAVYWVGAHLLYTSQMAGEGVSLGGVFAFIGIYGELVWPMIASGWVVNVLERGAASMHRIATILDAEPDLPPPDPDADEDSGNDFNGQIEFRDLTFAYNGKPVLKNIDLVIEPGKTVGVVGQVGSGKSTLLSLIPRLYPAPAGSLFLDGRDINDIPISAVRRAVATVPQETFLFSDTIRENIAFGIDDAEQNAIAQAAERAQIAESIEEFPDKYGTMLGERGINLSGGQKQRTALARALLRDCKIILLDDSLAAVDTETEERILQGLRAELAGRTALLVSHRISAVAMADEIIVLDEGRITERGTHEELLQNGGLYAELAQRQQLVDEIERANDANGLPAQEEDSP